MWLFSQQELKDITISILVITAILVWPHFWPPLNWLIALLVVVIAFLFHELAHRTVARHFGCVAFYRMSPNGLMFSLLFTLLSGGRLKFIMPGAVMIYPYVGLWGWRRAYLSRREMGLISLAGPAVNLTFGTLCFLLLHLVTPSPVLALILIWLVGINGWLAFFNLWPLGALDGRKVFMWNWRVWLIMIVAAGLLAFGM
jgi:Zn-dependent protease